METETLIYDPTLVEANHEVQEARRLEAETQAWTTYIIYEDSADRPGRPHRHDGHSAHDRALDIQMFALLEESRQRLNTATANLEQVRYGLDEIEHILSHEFTDAEVKESGKGRRSKKS